VRGYITQLYEQVKAGSFHAIAKCITILENELHGSEELLGMFTEERRTPVIGITGPPGAGKSTLVSELIGAWLKQNKKIAVVAVDPSSPFNFGALLGDRIRMNEYYTHPNVYIRSLASRGALGGLSKKIIDIAGLIKQANFDIILVETVGVGQSEVEIAGLADVTVVALVPEAGDEVQTWKAGIMEIADIFVVNKADRENADSLYRNLRMMVHEKATDEAEIPVLKTVATNGTGVAELAAAIEAHFHEGRATSNKQVQLLAEKCWQVMQAALMKNFDFYAMKHELSLAVRDKHFNLYKFSKDYLTTQRNNAHQ
jgi:LAO/AO transport system kinase